MPAGPALTFSCDPASLAWSLAPPRGPAAGGKGPVSSAPTAQGCLRWDPTLHIRGSSLGRGPQSLRALLSSAPVAPSGGLLYGVRERSEWAEMREALKQSLEHGQECVLGVALGYRKPVSSAHQSNFGTQVCMHVYLSCPHLQPGFPPEVIHSPRWFTDTRLQPQPVGPGGYVARSAGACGPDDTTRTPCESGRRPSRAACSEDSAGGSGALARQPGSAPDIPSVPVLPATLASRSAGLRFQPRLDLPSTSGL